VSWEPPQYRVEAVAVALAKYMGCQDCGTGPGECPCREAATAAIKADRQALLIHPLGKPHA